MGGAAAHGLEPALDHRRLQHVREMGGPAYGRTVLGPDPTGVEIATADVEERREVGQLAPRAAQC
eukprot:760078-Hanusia_phi.AAC.6